MNNAPTIDGLSLHEPIGRGGYATVWRATDDAFGRTVAVKVLDSRLDDEESTARFRRECRALGAVDGHPSIITTHRVGQTSDGRPFLVMALEAGGSLGDRLRHGPLPPDAVTDIGVQIADALATAHAAGVLHRDVKPDNILMDANGAPKLTDFGIARLTGATNTTTGVITASIAHAAPEVLDGRQPDERSDVYSLCSTLYALVTGDPPFYRRGEESVVPLITRILTMPAPTLSQVAPPALAQAIAFGLHKDPDARITSAAELRGRLGTSTPYPQPYHPAEPQADQTPRPPQPQAPQQPHARGPGLDPGGFASGQENSPTPARWRVPAVIALAVVLLGGLLTYVLARDDAPQVAEGPAAATAPPTVDPLAAAPAQATDEATSADQRDVSIAELSQVPLQVGDLSNVSLIDETVWEGEADGEAPLLNYAYCEEPLDLTGVESTVVTVLSDNIQDGVFTFSFAAEASSPDVWVRVVDDIVANAGSCQEFVTGNGLSNVFIDSVERTDTGAVIAVHFESNVELLDDGPPQTSYIEIDGRFLTALDLPEASSEDSDTLRQVVKDRLAALTR